MASTTGKNAREAAGNVADQASNLLSAGAEKAKDLASTAGQMADKATATVGSSIESLGGTLRENAPHSGMMGTAASTVASTLEGTGRYLREEGLSGMFDDVTDLVKRNPTTAVLIAIGFGFLMARLTRD